MTMIFLWVFVAGAGVLLISGLYILYYQAHQEWKMENGTFHTKDKQKRPDKLIRISNFSSNQEEDEL